MSRVYATAADLAAYTGQAAPTDADRLLSRASRMLDSQVFRLCWYQVDDAGLPTDTTVLAAFRDATCAQVEWWDEIGDSTGAAAAGWSVVEIGSAKLVRSQTATSGADSPARQVAPAVWDALQSPDLTTKRFVLGAVVT